ncbi:ABC-type sugar transport system, periplasmic component [Brachybacterium faecium DSM 4810]|uniref:ABC-type sugar transport system, periplasmic component n=1 Tax=Brachybacterium faecium (strain ATCC 43885 / DSM 4810 / JCM 11609 / LMG 19847 / NBRC 14762 / NCIMB 9860 / 6-10) TaxID=446465 RepID=C7MH88_BRAFD|nr:extracellular solute-binding protein [Brachybacterium faecium]ACU86536.1 ABC-type sugar transport system, periplasmic component [Brachybacterium faecium DSM 4810]
MATRRDFLAGLAAGAAVTALPSCGANTADDATLTVLHKWPEGDHAAFFEHLRGEFEAANPGVRVDLTAVQDDPYKERIRVLTASRTLPDVYFLWPGSYGEQFASAGLTYDLTDEMAGGWSDSLSPVSVDAYLYDDRNYAVPISMSGKYMVSNTALFDDYGVGIPSTFDDLLAACDTFREEGLTPIAMGNQPMWPGVHYLTTLIAKHVPDADFSRDLVPETATFAHPGYARAFADLHELSERGFTRSANGISSDSAKAAFLNGQAPMMYSESNQFSTFREKNGAPPELAENWDFFPFPSIPDGAGDDDSLTGAPDGFAINPESENIDLALDFLRLLSSPEMGAAMLSMRDRPSVVIGSSDEVDDVQPQLTRAIEHLDSIEHFNIWLDMEAKPQVAQAWLTAGQAAIDGSRSPEQIVQDLKEVSDASR